MIRRISLLFALVLLAWLPAAPAVAHSESGPAATNYLTRITNVTPRVEGLRLRVVDGGSRLELRNETGQPIEVYGYSAEPYLRIADAVFVNTHSTTAYTNEDLPKADASQADATAAPQWKKLSNRESVVWHDHRTHWMDEHAPAVVTQAPGQGHQILTWEVPIRVGNTPVRAMGTLDYLPPPASSLWWAAIVAGVGVVIMLGLSRFGVTISALLLGLAAVAELADGVARVLDTGATGWSAVLGLLSNETYGVLTAVAALGAAWLGVRRVAAAPFALALAALCLGVLGALTDISVFSYGRATAAWDGDLSRLCTVITLSISAGVAVAGWLRVRADGRTRKAVPTGAAPVALSH